jgi:GTPase Era involved in 16S rRNA processing
MRTLKKIFDWKVELQLSVKVNKDWRTKDAVLNRVLG